MRELSIHEMELVAGADAPQGPTDVISDMANGATAGAAIGAGIGLITGGPAGAASGAIAGGAVGAVAGGAASLYELYTQPEPKGEVSVELTGNSQDGNDYCADGGNY
ncbi:hypothetical protein HGD77_14305 [Acinetobacter sp. NEB149]|uniref:hypothetical protein n=1 Tax=Acinetobacter TaxID=469 RepID=UPI0014499A4B|nr:MULTISPECIES: hypothetical protein [Acinetobacter]MCU4422419.1 hypothetical protein [Acinetobacter lwoffii]MCU4449421.1 hypothetical protein [Acinetobacter lwoffii]QJB49725.1 hypothetical protein HGD77_14305 [Acinetobacter sp. NEB149]